MGLSSIQHILKVYWLLFTRIQTSTKNSPLELLQFIYNFSLEASIPEVVELLKLNASIALSSASVDLSFSCLERVKTCLRNTMVQERIGSLWRTDMVLVEGRVCQFKSVHRIILSISENIISKDGPVVRDVD